MYKLTQILDYYFPARVGRRFARKRKIVIESRKATEDYLKWMRRLKKKYYCPRPTYTPPDFLSRKREIKIIPPNTWVRVKGGATLRYVTKANTKECFEDDGKVSAQSPSSYCHYKNYEPCKTLPKGAIQTRIQNIIFEGAPQLKGGDAIKLMNHLTQATKKVTEYITTLNPQQDENNQKEL